MRVAFDCDGTLVDYNGKLRDEVCQLLIAFMGSGFKVIVWSGGGKNYAENIFRRVVDHYQLLDGMSYDVSQVECKSKDSSKPELAIDDEHVNLGHFNLRWRPNFRRNEEGI